MTVFHVGNHFTKKHTCLVSIYILLLGDDLVRTAFLEGQSRNLIIYSIYYHKFIIFDCFIDYHYYYYYYYYYL